MINSEIEQIISKYSVNCILTYLQEHHLEEFSEWDIGAKFEDGERVFSNREARDLFG
jgi:hypothetical protein